MDLQLEGKRALVTGSSTGIGECIAKVLAQEGVLVAVHGRDEERTNGVAEEIVAKGGKAFAVTGDLAMDDGALQVADNIKKFFLDVAKERGWGTDWADIEKHVLKEWMGTLTGRLGKVEDVANLVAFVASPLADYINAANFRVDGGSFL